MFWVSHAHLKVAKMVRVEFRKLEYTLQSFRELLLLPSPPPLLLFLLLLLTTAPVAYGSSQARGQIGAAAAHQRHSHSNEGSKLHLWSTYTTYGNNESLTHWASPRDWTCVLMDTNHIRFCWATTGTPRPPLSLGWPCTSAFKLGHLRVERGTINKLYKHNRFKKTNTVWEQVWKWSTFFI